ncbi:MAG: ammonium transporter [Candidatus Aenigmarchaeota archaeon]|nr:ammonium transporter [Candidatus Aenigmarchaeota archaeon]
MESKTFLVLTSVILALGMSSTALAQEFNATNHLWVLISFCLIFSMQAGFAMLESGSVPESNVYVVAFKNLIDWTLVSIAYFFIGFGIQFGLTSSGLFGSSFLLLNGLGYGTHAVGGWTYFMFQLAFAGTAATIVSGAIAGRTGFFAYYVFSILMGALIYPVFGHWAWGNGILSQGTLLTSMGYIDFAGSSVVHMTGGVASLVGAILIGPRLGRFGIDGKPRDPPSYPTSGALVVLGTLVLWFGWFGFNGGSTLVAGDFAGRVIFNTNLAASAASVAAFLHAKHLQGKRYIGNKIIGGTITGLVAITANSHMVAPIGALLIGIFAGIIHNIAYELLLKLKIDDAVGAVPVHLFGGMFGIISVALFGDAGIAAEFYKNVPIPLITGGMFAQLQVQIIGVLLNLLWVGVSSFAVYSLIKKFIGLRVSPEEEMAGVTLEGGVTVKKPEFHKMTEEELRSIAEGKAIEKKTMKVTIEETANERLVAWITSYMLMKDAKIEECKRMLIEKGWSRDDVERAAKKGGF